MNITELDSYNLADAVKFNTQLNPAIWQGQTMKPEVREQLLAIAEDFKEFLGLSDIDVKDVTVSGSNAGYTYTPNSDIDLHLVVDIPRADSDEVYRELFDAKKYQYNDQHNITIGGYEVELYVENANKPPVSQGVFSVLHNDWINIPKKRRATVDDDAVRSKYEDLKNRIERAVKKGNLTTITRLANKIKRIRQAGLDQHGELGSENLAYKMLRNQGIIKQLYDARQQAKSRELSIDESNMLPKPRMTYGFKTPVKPDLGEDAGMTWDGVSPSTKMFLSETDQDEEILKDFIEFCFKELKLEHMPTIKLRKDPQWSVRHKTFGRYINDQHLLEVAWGQRHIMDVLRTVAHELTHKHQHERDGDRMGPEAGETGSKWENEANARAGILMRDYARLHPDYFAVGQAQGLKEGTGYIPTAAEMHDPRFEMAITQDVRPGAIGRAANAFMLNTDSQGHPQELRPDGLVKRLAEQLAAFKQPLSESEQLDEINMGGKSLRKLSKPIGALAGIEFEMIVPNVEGGNSDGDEEPDYDADESAYSIDQICDFFEDGDYNSRGDIRRLREALSEDYLEWRDEKINTAWDEDGFSDFFVDWVANNISQNDINDFFKRPADHDISQSDVMDYANKLWGEDDDSKHDAYEEFRDDMVEDSEYDQEHWLDDEELGLMSDIESKYSISWPYWRYSGNGGVYSIESVADSFERAIGRPVMWGDDYHDIDRDRAYQQGAYIVEPDGSLEPDSSNDRGLEFVSPPLPLDELAKDMQKVRAWAKDNNCYTSKRNKTGLHINVSVPGLDEEMKNLDLVKLALMLGDNYVAQEFGRLGNTYAKSVYNIVMNNIRNRPETAELLLDKMRENLSRAATRVIHNVKTDKYSSINVKDGYIEFRSPGGDWLDANFDKIQKTLQRFVVATDAAVDPDKYRKEYLKKLYRALSGTEIEHATDPTTGKKTFKINTEADFAKLLSEYMAGKFDRDELKRIATYQRQLGQDQPGTKQVYRMVNPDTDQEYARFTTTSAEKADAQAKLYGVEHDIPWNQYIVLDPNMQVVGGDLRHTAKPGRHSDPNGRYEIVNRTSGAGAQPRFMFSVEPQQIPYVLQAWADRHNTTPADWKVIEIDSGNEMPSSRASYASASGIDPLWSVYLRANMARSVEVRAPNQQAALAAAKHADPDSFPDSVTMNDVMISDIEPSAPQPNSRSLPPSDPRGDWVVLSPRSDDVLYRFRADTRNDAERIKWSWCNANGVTDPDAYRLAHRADTLPPTGSANHYIIFRGMDPTNVVATFAAPDHQSAIERVAQYRRDHPGAEYNVQLQSDIEEIPLDIEVNYPQPASGGNFTGQWRVLDGLGREVYRFGGVGNNQADANRVASEWMQQHGRGGNFEVYPIMA